MAGLDPAIRLATLFAHARHGWAIRYPEIGSKQVFVRSGLDVAYHDQASLKTLRSVCRQQIVYLCRGQQPHGGASQQQKKLCRLFKFLGRVNRVCQRLA